MPICTPEQANNKQCRVIPPVILQRQVGAGVLVADGQQPQTAQIDMRFTNCMANQCMSWVWAGGGRGYCGRGEPGVHFEDPPPQPTGGPPAGLIDRRR